MNIQHLKLTGYTGIKKGMGLDTVEIDFSGLSGLIAFQAKTGSGKTTILENCQPYPQMISRPEKALKNHVFDRNSIKELSFYHNDALYETLVKIDAQSGKSEGFIYLNGHPEVKGKITEFKKYIEDLFGSEQLFFSSVFCAQNSVRLSGLQPAQLKALFVEFLGERLKKLEGYENTAKQCGNVMAGRLSTINTLIDTKQDIINDIGDVETQFKHLTRGKIRAETELAELKTLSESLLKQKSEIEKSMAMQSEYRSRAEALQTDLEAANKELLAEVEEARAKRADVDGRIRAIDAELDKIAGIVARKHDIETAVTTLKSTEKTIETLDADLKEASETLQATRAESAEREREVMVAKAAGVEVKNRLEALKEDVARTEKMAALLDKRGKVTCIALCADHPVEFYCNSEDCSFIEHALEASREKPEIEKKIKECEKELEEARTIYGKLADALKKATEDLEPLQKHVAKLEKSRAVVLTERTSLKQTADLLPELRAAESRKETAVKSRSEIMEDFKAYQEKHETKTGDLQKKLDSLKEQHKEVAGKIDPEIDKKLNHILYQISDNSAQIEQKEKMVSEAAGELRRLESEIDKKAALYKEITELKHDKERITRELADWRYLQGACGANGLRALEIDAVAPTITADANRLLEEAFGSWAMVDFRTVDDDGREVLEPRAIDQDGDSVLIGNRSGGEQVWCLKALRLAMTIVSKEKSGRDYRTAYADEDDSGLDEETAKDYTQLYHAFLKLGGFDKCLYISHKPGSVNLADHIIQLKSGGIEII